MFSTDYPAIDERHEVDGRMVPVVYLYNDGHGGVVTPSKWTPRCVTLGQLRAFAGLWDKLVDGDAAEGGDTVPLVEIELHRVDCDVYPVDGDPVISFYYVITGGIEVTSHYRGQLTVDQDGEILFQDELDGRKHDKHFQYPFNGVSE